MRWYALKMPPGTTEDMTLFMSTRLLDVANSKIKLIDSKRNMEGADRRYLALSHCWGPVPIIRTMRNNYDKHNDQLLPEELSKAFREAIHVTLKLGFRYIWIDSLCIIQDDSSDWAVEAATICDVYQYAALNCNSSCSKRRCGMLHGEGGTIESPLSH